MISQKRVRAFKKQVVDPQKGLETRGFEQTAEEVVQEKKDAFLKEYEVFLNTSDVRGILDIVPKCQEGISRLWSICTFEKQPSTEHTRTVRGELCEKELIRKLGELEKPLKDISWWLRILFIIFIPLTALLAFQAGKLRFDSYVPHIQEWYPSHNQWTRFFFVEAKSTALAYFVIDIFWGFLLALILFLVHKWFAQWFAFQLSIQGKKRESTGTGSLLLSQRSVTILFGIAILATLTDWIEFPLNWLGINFDPKGNPRFWARGLELIVPLKYGAFTLLILNALYQGLYYLFTRQQTSTVIKRFWAQNSTTFLVALVILYILTKMGQGGALVESLLERPWQYVLPFVVLLNFLAMMSWQWPYYHDLFRTLVPSKTNKDPKVAESPEIARISLLALFFPAKRKKASQNSFTLWEAFTQIIFFRRGEATLKHENEHNQYINWYDIQRLLSVIFFVLAIFVFFDHWKNSGGPESVRLIPLIFFVGITWGYFSLRARFMPLKEAMDLCGSAKDSESRHTKLLALFQRDPDLQKKSRRFLILFHSLLWISFLGILISFLMYVDGPQDTGPTRIVKLTSILFFNAIFYLPLTLIRSYLPVLPKLSTLPSQSAEKSSPKLWVRLLTLFQRPITALWGKDQNFMGILLLVARFSLIGVILLNIFYQLNTWMHPINIALIYVIFLFSILNFFVKGAQVIFYENNLAQIDEASTQKRARVKNQYRILISTLICVLGALYFVSSGNENHFHEQEQIPILSEGASKSAPGTSSYSSHVREGIPFKEYFETRWKLALLDTIRRQVDSATNAPASLQEPFYLIASDGGGLRAAYWTLLVLHRMDSLSGERLFDRTLAMSGASGGMIGLGMYMAIKHHSESSTTRRKVIDQIGNANFFSNDLTFLLGKNIFKNFIPINVNWMDDGSEKMALHYMKIAAGIAKGNSIKAMKGSIAELDQPYRKVWYDNYIKSDSIYPLLLTNSTQTEESRKGIASPLKGEEDIFKASISMLDFPQKQNSVSLSFADALFTCNRFPVLSQAAEIQNKGHFIDAGGFDNSGISSLLDLIDYMKTKHDSLYEKYKGNIILISIHNDGATYITNHFEEFRDSLHQMKPVGEFSPLLNVGYTRGILGEPAFMEDLAEQWEEKGLIEKYVEIDLPFPVSRDRIQHVYRGQLKTEPVKLSPCSDRSCDTLQQKVELLNVMTYASLWDNTGIIKELRQVHEKREKLNWAIKYNKKVQKRYLVEPTLGRILSTPAVDYMQKMLRHPEVEDKLNQLSGKE